MTVMGATFQAFFTSSAGIGCKKSGFWEEEGACYERMRLSGYSPLEITAIYINPGTLTITLNGNWPDTTGWQIVNQEVSLNGSHTLSFDDATVVGRYAMWTGIDTSQVRDNYTTLGPITKPAS